jgi:DNA-binding MarR family transcriptional regulator
MLMAHDSRSEPEIELEIELIRAALVGLRRLFQHRELAQLWAAAFGKRTELDYGELRLLDAVAIGDAGTASVGEIAIRLGIDPSRASRQVARAVRRGMLARRVAQADGRRVVLAVTRAGEALRRRGSELTRARIALALTGWSAADRARFATMFGRFSDGMVAPPVVASGDGAPVSGPRKPRERARRAGRGAPAVAPRAGARVRAPRGRAGGARDRAG